MRVAIIDLLRTPIGEFGGALKDISAPHLGAKVIKELVRRNNLDSVQIDEVIMGNVLQAGLGQNPARQAAVYADIPVEVSSFTVNKVCGSGLKAIILAAQTIALGDAQIIIAGGMENMSAAPHLIKKARWGLRLGDGTIIDSIISEGLSCIFEGVHMGITAENIAQEYGISREEQDEFALASQQKAEKSIESGKVKDEILPIELAGKKGEITVFAKDEHPRPGLTIEKLKALKPAFKKDGSVTAGNASGINDGAAAVLLMSEDMAAQLNLKPKAFIKDYAYAGVEPKFMGLGPIAATKKLLNKTGFTIDDFDLVEANEAFAAQAIAVGRELKWDNKKVNVNGGAIAYGHPIGATGAKILVSLVYEMIRRESKLGLATLCIGGGQGISLAVEK